MRNATLLLFDIDENEWIDAASTCNDSVEDDNSSESPSSSAVINGELRVRVCHLSSFALLDDSGALIESPSSMTDDNMSDMAPSVDSVVEEDTMAAPSPDVMMAVEGEEDGGGVSGGVVAAIIIVLLALCGAIGAVAFWRHRKSKEEYLAADEYATQLRERKASERGTEVE